MTTTSKQSIGVSANATVGWDQTPTPTAKREAEALQSASVCGYRRRMQGLPIKIMAQRTGISVERLTQLESLPEHSKPSSNESAQIYKILGSGDLFRPLTPEAAMEERIRLA
jgi:hypothetical protein